ncbi:tyrosine-type recombinase/integrase [Caballeronia mineralivorans]|jgi:integrase|uniref:tyrosine-type recombinase/integrase n=1 Tax=Caballeronia mineralivorans TaxID=2010198 RepID=UPI0023F0E5F5|nr:site-specific integrase [Caballeronia mineralivorans]MDB5789957.1 hypothetical protein [Caballeronia mineralivorans]MEA3100568.1 hypothetical protein [Caballeronia mineralivorans]
MKLTQAFLLNAKPGAKPYKLRDDKATNLYLHVSTAGGKRWKFDYRLGGTDGTYTLGSFPQVTLIAARKLRNEAAELVEKGIHPKAQDKQVQTGNIEHFKNTLWLNCAAWLEDNKSKWSEYYGVQAERLLTRYVKETELGGMPIKSVTPGHIYRLLQSIAKRKKRENEERKAGGAPYIAVGIRLHLDGVFRRAVINGTANINPVSALKLSDAVRLPEVRHNRALEAPALKMVLCAMTMNGRPFTRLAMRLLMLTSVRTAELRGATWKEFDLEKREWTIAGQRMKMKRSHLIPLSVQAVEVLRKVEALNPKHKSGDFLFPHTKDATKTMSAGTINAVFKRAGFNKDQSFRAHGARGTFSTWAHENGFNPLAIERQLSHVEKNVVKRAYNQAEFLSERQKLMQVWADYLDSIYQ